MNILILHVRHSAGRFACLFALVLIAWGAVHQDNRTSASMGSTTNSAQWLSVYYGVIGGVAIAVAAAIDQLRHSRTDQTEIVRVSGRPVLTEKLAIAGGTLVWALLLLASTVLMTTLRVLAVTGSLGFPGAIYALSLGAGVLSVLLGAALSLAWPSRIILFVIAFLMYGVYVLTELGGDDSVWKRLVPISDQSWDPLYGANVKHVGLAFAADVLIGLAMLIVVIAVRSRDRVAARLGSAVLTLAVLTAALVVALPSGTPFFADPVAPPTNPHCATVEPGGKMCVWPDHKYRLDNWAMGLGPALKATAGLSDYPRWFIEFGLAKSRPGTYQFNLANTEPSPQDITLDAISAVPQQIVNACHSTPGDDATQVAAAVQQLLFMRVAPTSRPTSGAVPAERLKPLLTASRSDQDHWLESAARIPEGDCAWPELR